MQHRECVVMSSIGDFGDFIVGFVLIPIYLKSKIDFSIPDLYDCCSQSELRQSKHKKTRKI